MTSAAESILEQCHINYCNSIFKMFLSNEITQQTFIHNYYYTMKPLSQNYQFPIPEAISNYIDQLEYPGYHKSS